MAWQKNNLSSMSARFAGFAMAMHLCEMVGTRKSRISHMEGFPGT